MYKYVVYGSEDEGDAELADGCYFGYPVRPVRLVAVD